ncbi:MAG: hypothetical protein OJF52_000239 [Nitrospira sp.]|nr:MAG: hypothetical protein OJF52_000239 [Nitrospira sp.]
MGAARGISVWKLNGMENCPDKCGVRVKGVAEGGVREPLS